MIEKKYALPGKLNDEEIKEMERFKAMDDPYVHRTNIIAGILHYLGTYCWPSIMTSYYDEDIKKSFITEFKVRIDPKLLGRGLQVCYGSDFMVKQPFIIEMAFSLMDSKYLTAKSISFRWANSDWSTPDFSAEPDTIIDYINSSNYLDMANIIHKLLIEKLQIEGDVPNERNSNREDATSGVQ